MTKFLEKIDIPFTFKASLVCFVERTFSMVEVISNILAILFIVKRACLLTVKENSSVVRINLFGLWRFVKLPVRQQPHFRALWVLQIL